jgi:hypothetical protein
VHSAYIVFPITRLRKFVIKMLWQLLLQIKGHLEVKSKKKDSDISKTRKYIMDTTIETFGTGYELYADYFASFFDGYEFITITK